MKELLTISKKDLSHLLYDEKLTQNEIAALKDVSRTSVYRKMQKYGLTRLEIYKRFPNELNHLQKDVLAGSILGDDCIYKYESSNYASLLVYHSLIYKDYVDLKFAIWKDFINYDEPKKYVRENGIRLGFITCCHPIFAELRKIYYDENRRKIINLDILNKINDVGLAFWFMDDGSRCKNGGLAIHTNCFTLEEVELSCLWLKNKYNILCHPQKRAENQWVIFIENKTSFDFAELIINKMPLCMRYKLEGVYNYVKNPQRLNAIPFIYENLIGKS